MNGLTDLPVNHNFTKFPFRFVVCWLNAFDLSKLPQRLKLFQQIFCNNTQLPVGVGYGFFQIFPNPFPKPAKGVLDKVPQIF